jgi:hypothetical protein
VITGTAIVSVIALLGYLMLSWRSSEVQDLSMAQKARFGGAWVLIFAGIAFIASRFGA